MTIPYDKLSDLAFSWVRCPRCKALAQTHCRTREGKRMLGVHEKRVRAYLAYRRGR